MLTTDPHLAPSLIRLWAFVASSTASFTLLLVKASIKISYNKCWIAVESKNGGAGRIMWYCFVSCSLLTVKISIPVHIVMSMHRKTLIQRDLQEHVRDLDSDLRDKPLTVPLHLLQIVYICHTHLTFSQLTRSSSSHSFI